MAPRDHIDVSEAAGFPLPCHTRFRPCRGGLHVNLCWFTAITAVVCWVKPYLAGGGCKQPPCPISPIKRQITNPKTNPPRKSSTIVPEILYRLRHLRGFVRKPPLSPCLLWGCLISVDPGPSSCLNKTGLISFLLWVFPGRFDTLIYKFITQNDIC